MLYNIDIKSTDCGVSCVLTMILALSSYVAFQCLHSLCKMRE